MKLATQGSGSVLHRAELVEFQLDALIVAAPDSWKRERAALIRALSLTSDPKQYLERVYAALRTCIDDLSLAVRGGKVEIDSAGHVRLSAIQALEVVREATRMILPLHIRTRPMRNVAPVVQADLGEAAQPVAAGTRAAISFSGSSAGGPR